MSGDTIPREEARALVGKLLFGHTFIDGLTEAERALLAGDHGPKKIRVVRPDGRLGGELVDGNWIAAIVEVFLVDAPGPSGAAARDLDLALGRQRRMEIQGRTVDDWIETVARLDVTRESLDRAALEAAIAQHPRPSSARSGPAPATTKRVARYMIADIANGSTTLEALRSEKQAALAARYGVSRGTAMKALALVGDADTTLTKRP